MCFLLRFGTLRHCTIQCLCSNSGVTLINTVHPFLHICAVLCVCVCVCVCVLRSSLEKSRMETEDQLAMYKETVKVKDDVVVQLTNTIFQLENKGQVPGE